MNKKNLIIVLFIFSVTSFLLPTTNFHCGIQTNEMGEFIGHISCFNGTIKTLLNFLNLFCGAIFFVIFISSFFFKNVKKRYFIELGAIFILSMIIKYFLYFYIIYLDNHYLEKMMS